MADITPYHINSYSRFMGGVNVRLLGIGGPASVVWPSANLAVYIPFSLPWSYTVRRVFVGNGATLNGNIDIGIYNSAGARQYSSGSTAQAGTSAIQYITLGSPLVLAAGTYFLAVASNSATATFQMAGTNMPTSGRLAGLLQQATAFPLPATATFAQWSQTTGYLLCGVTRTATGF